MLSVHFATSNKNKAKTITKELEEQGIEVHHTDIELIEPQDNDVRAIAAQKAIQAFRHIQKPTIVQDSGFYIPLLGGWPATFVKEIMSNSKMGIQAILDLIHARGARKTPAFFKNCLAYLDENEKTPKLFTCSYYGLITDEVFSGKVNCEDWSDLWRIFIPKGLSNVLAALSKEEYYQHKHTCSSQRSSSVRQFAQWLTSNQ